MEIFFFFFFGILAIAASVFGVRNRINNFCLGIRRNIRDDRSRYNDRISDKKKKKRDKEGVEELDARDTDKLKECSRIGSRIRKREQEADTTE